MSQPNLCMSFLLYFSKSLEMIHKESVSKKNRIRNVLNGYMSIFSMTAYWGRGAAENAPTLLCGSPQQPVSSHMTSILTDTT